jgi:hypothetical protein
MRTDETSEVIRDHDYEDHRRKRIENDRLEQETVLRGRVFEDELALRARYAKSLLRLMVVQLAAATAVFVAYSWRGQRWDVPPDVVKTWLTATVVQVFGVVAVVTRHLFPNRRKTPLDV